MRRLVGVIVAGMLAIVLSADIASASLVPMAQSSFDLSPVLMLRLFGETSDVRSSLAAAYGDRNSESPLRELALHGGGASHPTEFVRDAVGAPTFAGVRASRAATPVADNFDLGQTIRNRLLQTTPHFAPASLAPGSVAPASPYDAMHASTAATFTAGAYQPVAPVPLISPELGASSFRPLTRGAAVGLSESSALAFGAAGAPAGSTGSSAVAPATVRVGPLQVRTRLESASLAVPQLSLNDNGYGAGANFDVRAGARNVNVDLSSNYERLTRGDTSGFSSPALSASNWQLPNLDAPLVIPNYADLSKVSVGAAVAVPVVTGLTLGLNYATDRMFGGYGLPGVSNLDATDNSYGGKLTLVIPHSSSTLSISARQLRYQDNLLPSNTFTQTREDVNFTVKF